MKGIKVNMDMVNCGLLLVVLVLVVMCCVKREGYTSFNNSLYKYKAQSRNDAVQFMPNNVSGEARGGNGGGVPKKGAPSR
jgi:hypothetical protein